MKELDIVKKIIDSNQKNEDSNEEGKSDEKKDAMSKLAHLKIMLIAFGFFIVIILIMALIGAIIDIFTIDTFDHKNGKMSSVYGIEGDKFYGGRILYKDDEKSAEEMQEIYLTFTNNVLNGANSQLNIDGLTTDHETDVYTNTITVEFANALAGGTEKSLLECVNLIDHFGFSADEVTIVIDSIANSLTTVRDDGNAYTSATNVKDIITNEINKSSYSYYKNVYDKVYVKDYILAKKRDVIEDLEKLNYVGFVYMPKQDVTFKSFSYRFIVDGGYGVNVELKHKTATEIVSLIEPTNVDVTWYDNGDYKLYESENMSLKVTQFTAINTGNTTELSNGVSVFSLFANGQFATYFKTVEDGNYTAKVLLENINSSEYIYLQGDSQQKYNFAEYLVEYE